MRLKCTRVKYIISIKVSCTVYRHSSQELHLDILHLTSCWHLFVQMIIAVTVTKHITDAGHNNLIPRQTLSCSERMCFHHLYETWKRLSWSHIFRYVSNKFAACVCIFLPLLRRFADSDSKYSFFLHLRFCFELYFIFLMQIFFFCFEQFWKLDSFVKNITKSCRSLYLVHSWHVANFWH